MVHDQRPYWQKRRDMKLGVSSPVKKGDAKSKKAAKKKTAKKLLSDWFELQIEMAPKKCENCGCLLSPSMAINPRTIVCHIVPKKDEYGCPSVATHPLNRWYGCSACHDRYDTGGQKAATMHVIDIAVARLNTFIHLIPKEERRFIPKFLLNGQ